MADDSRSIKATRRGGAQRTYADNNVVSMSSATCAASNGGVIGNQIGAIYKQMGA